MVGDTPKFIDFVGIERFDSILNSHLVNIVNYMKAKERESQVNLFPQLMSCKFGKKTKGLKYSKYLFAWDGRVQISTINLRMSFFQVKGSDVGHNQQLDFCYLLIWYLICSFRNFRFRVIISMFLGAFNVS